MKYSVSLLFCVLYFSNSAGLLAQEISHEKLLSEQSVNATLYHQSSAETQYLYLELYDYAKIKLDKNIADSKYPEKKKAVILDIDETVLDNSKYQAWLAYNGLLYTPETWKKWTSEASASALPGAIEFVKYAKMRGVEVFYITNREDDELDATIDNLEYLEFPNADSNHIFTMNITSDKTERRKLVSMKYEVVLLVGDVLTDYSEVFANRDNLLGFELIDKELKPLLKYFVLLPNPMYGEWEKAIFNNNYQLPAKEKLELKKRHLRKWR